VYNPENFVFYVNPVGSKMNIEASAPAVLPAKGDVYRDHDYNTISDSNHRWTNFKQLLAIY